MYYQVSHVGVVCRRHDGGLTRKVGCARKRLDGSNYCVEHLIADRFGRHLAKLDASRPPRD